MKYDRIEGIDKDISKLVMGCDNQDDINEAQGCGIIGLK